MPRAARIAVIALAVAAPVLALSLGREGGPADPFATEGGAALDASAEGRALGHLFRGRPPAPGVRLAYTFRWRTSQATRASFGPGEGAGGEGLTGDADIEGDLVLEVARRRGGRTLVRAAMRGVNARSWRLLGAELLPDAGAGALDLDAELYIGNEGQLLELRVATSGAPIAKLLLQSVIAQLLLSLRGGDARAWSVVEEAPLGRAAADYAVQSPAPFRIARRRARYVELRAFPQGEGALEQELSSRTDATFGVDGALSAISTSEALTVRRGRASLLTSSTVFEASLREASRAAPPRRVDAGSFEARDPWHAPVDPATERRMLVQRVGSMTESRLRDEVRLYASIMATDRSTLDVLDDHTEVMFQGTGLLRLAPEACASLAPLFFEPGAGVAGRGLVVDLLVGAGSAEAQRALRGILAAPETRALPDYPNLLQRVGFLTEPELATAEHVAATYQRARGAPDDASAFAEWMAATYALGSLAGTLGRSEVGPKHAWSAGARRMLVDDLTRDAAGTPGEPARAIVAALGNAGLPQDLDLLLLFAASPDGEMRKQATYALRRIDHPRARDALHVRLADEDDAVAAAAVLALDAQALDERDAARIAGAVTAGQTRPAIDPKIVALFARRLFPLAVVEGALFAIERRAPGPVVERASHLRRELAVLQAAALGD